MDTLHSLAGLREHFDTVGAFSVSGGQHKPSQAHRKAYPDNLPIGSIVDIDARYAHKTYGKEQGIRPALVTALWRDQAGELKKIELAYITTNVGKIYPDTLLLDTPELQKDFRRNKVAGIELCHTIIVDNIFENFPVTSRPPFEIPRKYWQDIILRRADAILHNAGLRTEVQGCLSGLTREGIFFTNIRDENVMGCDFVPEIPGKSTRRTWAEVPQFRVNWLARCAEFYRRTQPSTLRHSHQFPPAEEWPSHFPKELGFRKFDKTRGYAAPALAAE